MNRNFALTKVQSQIENAKSDPDKLMSFLEQVEDEATDEQLALGAMRLRKQLIAGGKNGADMIRVYRFLFRHAVEHFVEKGGFRE
jgi:hypothetical protein